MRTTRPDVVTNGRRLALNVTSDPPHNLTSVFVINQTRCDLRWSSTGIFHVIYSICFLVMRPKPHFTFHYSRRRVGGILCRCRGTLLGSCLPAVQCFGCGRYRWGLWDSSGCLQTCLEVSIPSIIIV